MKTLSHKARMAVPATVVAVAVTSFGLLASGAWFTSTATVPNNSFSTGSVSIDATPDTAALTLANMAPGDTVVAPITVRNTGPLALKYDVSAAFPGTLQAALRTTVKTGVTACTTAGFSSTGTVVAAQSTVPATKTLLASRPTLAAGANEVLCVEVTLPGAGTGNAYQNTTATGTFTFEAVQSTNNP